MISMAPKRGSMLVYLPDGKTEIVSEYTFDGSDGKTYAVQNMGTYPDLSSEANALTDANGNPAGATGEQSAGPLAVFNVSDNDSTRQRATG